MGFDSDHPNTVPEELGEIDDILSRIDDLFQMEKRQPGTDASVGGRPRPGGMTEEDLRNRGFSEGQIQEILAGISQNLPVHIYAKNSYNWKQMYQIRMGLMQKVETKLFEDPLYTAEQMAEIRRGLVDRLDVSSYAKLIYAARDMSQRRKKLLEERYNENPSGFAKELTDEETGIQIRLSDDCLEAYIRVSRLRAAPSPQLMESVLKQYEVVYGIMQDQLERINTEHLYDEEVLVARGTPAKKGKSGRYEFFFNQMLPQSPRLQENGNVDYTEVVAAERVQRGMVLAKYHPGTQGESGKLVTGVTIKAVSGKELPPLTGSGFVRDPKNNIYAATTDGYVSLDEIHHSLHVRNVYEVEGDVNRYNGSITYDGTIHIKGSVKDMAVLNATGDVIVDGFVEGAEINAGGNVILKKGINAGGKGQIKARGKVMGSFFENASIEARGLVEGNYFLRCTVMSDSAVHARGGKARILGGEIKAAMAVESVIIGNYGGLRTTIDVGDLYWIDEKLDRLEEESDKVKEELMQLQQGRLKMETMFETSALQSNKLYKSTCAAIQTKESEQSSLLNQLRFYTRTRKGALSAYVKATGGIQEDVLLILNGTKRMVHEKVRVVSVAKPNTE